MRYNQFYAEQPWPVHPAKREHPHWIARLHVYGAEITDMEALCAKFGATVVGVERMPIIPAVIVETLCASGEEALALQVEWCEFCEISAHRPRTTAETAAFSVRHSGVADIPDDWRF
jgi:hypothetical protein